MRSCVIRHMLNVPRPSLGYILDSCEGYLVAGLYHRVALISLFKV